MFPKTHPVMKDEIFGPVLPVLGFDNMNKLIEMLKNHINPLALYIFTKNKNVQDRLMQTVPSGSVGINETVKQGATHYLPFGGIGESGMGMYHGRAPLNVFRTIKV